LLRDWLTFLQERKYKKEKQTGSESLYFAQCEDANETWLPLLEKAYAKVHGDYDSISGGWSGEGVEDMTGGVTTTIRLNRVLSKDKLWKDLLNVKKDFIFAASSPSYYGDDSAARQGIALGHAYSVLKAVEEVGEDDKKVRLVLIRNPWGLRGSMEIGEWNGPWSDGSKEWTPYWMKKLNHRFGDDGIFWISFDDLRRKFEILERTRLFDSSWTIVQQWTSVNVSYVSGYLTTKFMIEVTKAGTVIIVLSQIDDRYFKGLEGQYYFYLHFLLRDEHAPAGEHILRVRSSERPERSVCAEIDLEPGKYEILPKIVAKRWMQAPDVAAVVKKAALENPQKLRQIGLNYDLAHTKGGFLAQQAEKKKKEEEKKKKAKEAEEKKKKEEEEKKKEEEEKKKKEEEEAKKKEDEEKAKKEEEEKKKKKEEEAKKKAEEEETTKKAEAIKKEEDEKKINGVTKPADVNGPVDDAKTTDIKAETKGMIVQEIKQEVKQEVKEELTEEIKQDIEQAKEEVKEEVKQGIEQAKEAVKEEVKQDIEQAKEEVRQDVEKQVKDAKEDVTKDIKDKVDEATEEIKEQVKKEVEEIKEEIKAEQAKEEEKKTEEKKDETKTEETKAEETKPDVEEHPKSWNAIAVVGLRVYSKDKDLKITLIRPKDPEEAVSITVGGEKAGATI
jgi:hypothetical protein